MSVPDSRPDRRVYSPDFLTELFRNPLDPGYADAAARRAAGRAPARPGTARALSAVVLVLLGFLFVVAYRRTIAEEPNRTATRTALIEQIQRKRAATDDLEARTEALRSEITALRDRNLDGAAIARLRTLEGVTGLTRVRGDGIAVMLGDGRRTVRSDGKTDDGRVRDLELQLVVNELWAAGAEAVSVNGQRLTATTTIRLAGEAILVDKRPVSSPYEVIGLGRDELRNRFQKSIKVQGLRQMVKELGMRYELRELENHTMAAAPEPQLRFASPSAPPRPSGSASGPPVPSDSAGAASPAPSSTPSEGGR